MDTTHVNPYDSGVATPFPVLARQHVADYINEKIVETWNYLDKTFQDQIDISDVYVVWFAKTLQNWKALVSTTIEDGRYYEVTYNGEKSETYLDVYEKKDNVCIPD